MCGGGGGGGNCMKKESNYLMSIRFVITLKMSAEDRGMLLLYKKKGSILDQL